MTAVGRPLAAACLLLAVPLAGCETTAEKSARLAKLGRVRLKSEKGLAITRTNPYVKVISTAIVSDANGTAAAVTMRNDSGAALIDVPVGITVLGSDGATLFENNAPGLEPSLTSVPLLAPHASFTWVNDQITAAGTPRSVSAHIGPAADAPAPAPQIRVSGVSIYDDPTSGLAARGTVTDASAVAQQKLVIFAVARRGDRVVAAGRAIVPTLAPGKPTPFTVYFIGDPRGAQLRLSAPPTTLR